jgi:hypothetical protein
MMEVIGKLPAYLQLQQDSFDSSIPFVNNSKYGLKKGLDLQNFLGKMSMLNAPKFYFSILGCAGLINVLNSGI